MIIKSRIPREWYVPNSSNRTGFRTKIIGDYQNELVSINLDIDREKTIVQKHSIFINYSP